MFGFEKKENDPKKSMKEELYSLLAVTIGICVLAFVCLFLFLFDESISELTRYITAAILLAGIITMCFPVAFCLMDLRYVKSGNYPEFVGTAVGYDPCNNEGKRSILRPKIRNDETGKIIKTRITETEGATINGRYRFYIFPHTKICRVKEQISDAAECSCGKIHSKDKFSAADGWLFATLKDWDGKQLRIYNIVSFGDSVDFKFTLKDINDGLSRLQCAKFIGIGNGFLRLLPNGADFLQKYQMSESRKNRQTRFSEIFPQMTVGEDGEYIRFFTVAEYDLAWRDYAKQKL